MAEQPANRGEPDATGAAETKQAVAYDAAPELIE